MTEEAKQPKLTGFRRFMQFTAVFILGMVMGSIVYNVIYQTSYNLLWIQNKDLTIQLHQAEEDIRTLKKYNNRSTVIKEIKVRVEERDPPLDSLAVKEVAEQLHNELEVLRGRNIFDIDSDAKMARTLLNRKIYVVRDKEYSIQIKTMLVSDGVLQVWVDMRPYIRL
ncbi:hypothetical protein D3C76_191960 [compost metagenome]|uniref:Sporulation membrane protein YtrI C-terminal domain-containing protein n=2 Tax=Paenibacillus TaxID=44249 RepID=A0A9X2BS43_9BACL|nr:MULTISPECIES: hypothetical protein [Paenibacillus]MBW4839622.1 hypothetical protein [Paenibacillaceae bacterium]MBM6997536.1 hypothetical protein [Paenibacillus rhizolycopersici]MCK8489497.1 hypothetical protein [Paenibacillus mellifer]MUG87493.1 hypothetical protein [Paenibacillus timonensis]GIP47111.1 hypothetical protein J53TS2_07020 [Paenibacillus sp. J53TS2]